MLVSHWDEATRFFTGDLFAILVHLGKKLEEGFLVETRHLSP